ncbi:MAG: hypothetical protein IPQ09_10155 [Myxococcales bacterium]|nr:hypothetical protein [Myxococcales bacterium]
MRPAKALLKSARVVYGVEPADGCLASLRFTPGNQERKFEGDALAIAVSFAPERFRSCPLSSLCEFSVASVGFCESAQESEPKPPMADETTPTWMSTMGLNSALPVLHSLPSSAAGSARSPVGLPSSSTQFGVTRLLMRSGTASLRMACLSPMERELSMTKRRSILSTAACLTVVVKLTFVVGSCCDTGRERQPAPSAVTAPPTNTNLPSLIKPIGTLLGAFTEKNAENRENLIGGRPAVSTLATRAVQWWHRRPPSRILKHEPGHRARDAIWDR